MLPRLKDNFYPKLLPLTSHSLIFKAYLSGFARFGLWLCNFDQIANQCYVSFARTFFALSFPVLAWRRSWDKNRGQPTSFFVLGFLALSIIV